MNSYDEWKRKQRNNVGGRPDVVNFRLAQQAAVASQHLTGSADWDKFLTYIQAAIEGGQYAEQGWLARLTAPNSTPQDMTEAKIRLHEVRGAIAALNWVIAIPRNLREAGIVAEKLEFATTERG